MIQRMKHGARWALLGLCALLLGTLLVLALGQAIRLAGLYLATASPGTRPYAGWPWKLAMGPGSELPGVAVIAMILFFVVFRRPRRLLATSIIVLALFFGLNLISGRHLLPRILVWPAPNTLSEQYVEALARGDLDAALRLTDRSEECEAIMREAFEKHQAQFRQRLGDAWPEATGRSTSVQAIATFYDKPLPDQTIPVPLPVPQELATIMVATDNGTTVWFDLKESYEPLLGARYLCGQGIDS